MIGSQTDRQMNIKYLRTPLARFQSQEVGLSVNKWALYGKLEAANTIVGGLPRTAGLSFPLIAGDSCAQRLRATLGPPVTRETCYLDYFKHLCIGGKKGNVDSALFLKRLIKEQGQVSMTRS